METINLYDNESDGITIGLTAETDIVAPGNPEATVRVRGHRLYACSIEEARESIRREYLRRATLAEIGG